MLNVCVLVVVYFLILLRLKLLLVSIGILVRGWCMMLR